MHYKPISNHGDEWRKHAWVCGTLYPLTNYVNMTETCMQALLYTCKHACGITRTREHARSMHRKDGRSGNPGITNHFHHTSVLMPLILIHQTAISNAADSQSIRLRCTQTPLPRWLPSTHVHARTNHIRRCASKLGSDETEWTLSWFSQHPKASVNKTK